MIICFIRSLEELRRRIGQMAARDDFRSLWIAWPKKASGVSADLSQQTVREAGLAAGLVDYKICAIGATWSGLLFTRRRAKRGLADL